MESSLLEIISEYTVFCQIHTPARTPKYPEGCVYSGLISSKSNDVGWLRGFPKSASFVFNDGKCSVHAHSTHRNKMATSDFGPVTVISCEKALFFVYIWIILWDATYRSLTQHLTDC